MKMPEETPKRRAVIVGTDYKGAKGGIPPLKGAENDAREIFERLKDPMIGNFEIPKKHCLIGDAAKCANIRKAVSDVFYDTETSCDLALFYFSGHGYNDKWYGDLYLAPYDMIKKQPFTYGIKKSELRHVISKSRKSGQVKCAILILDCCYSGLETTDKDLSGEDTAFKEHVKDFSSEAEGVLTLASSAEEETSKEIEFEYKDENGKVIKKQYHGLFSSRLIAGLDCLTGECGKIHLGDLWKYIEGNIPKKKQKPITSHEGVSGYGTIVIAKSKAEWAKRLPLLQTAAQCEIAEEPSVLINAVPKVAAVLEINPNYKMALDLKNKIDKLLCAYQVPVRLWMRDNRQAIKDHRMWQILPQLEDLTVKNFPNFDEVAKLDQKKKDWFTNICEVVKGKMDQDVFLTYLKLDEQQIVSGKTEERQTSTVSDEFA